MNASHTALDPRGVPALLERLGAGRERLAALAIDERVALLDRVSRHWLTPGGPLRAAAAQVAAATGHGPAAVELSLERTFRAWSGAGLREAFAPARAALGARPEPRAAAAVAPELVAIVLAQNTPGLAFAPVYAALGLGAAVVVKAARGEPAFAELLAASIAEVSGDLGRACTACVWKGGDTAIEAPLFAAADRVVVYGSAPTIAAVRARAGERVIAHGPRVSLAVVASEAAGLHDVAARLARDVAFLDQRGCLSPQAVLHDASIDGEALGAALARELAACERLWPRRRLALAEAAAFRRAADEAEAALLAGRTRALHGGAGAPWAVVVEAAPGLAPTPLDRFVRLHPFASAEELAATLAPLAGQLECVGLEAEGEASGRLEGLCRRAGAARVCALGAMQDPPATWQAGGRAPVLELLRWGATELAPAASPDLRARFLAHVAQTSDEPRAIEVESATGAWVHDTAGGAWLDLLAGIGVASVGHAHPDVARAVAEQAARYTHVMVYGEDVLAPQVEVATRLAALLPPALSSVYLTNSGAEAIEGAIKLVRKATGRSRLLAFEGSFHGDTTGALALGGNPLYRDPFAPLLPGVALVPWDADEAIAAIDESVAAVFAEPVQAEAGVRVPRPDFLPRLAARCREVGALLVLDEVVTGLGRTGRWFAFEHWTGAEPDVLVLAKSLGGGLPLGAFVSSRERMAVLAHDPPLGHVTTFGGHPVSCAAAVAALDVLARERLPERAARVGERLRRELAAEIGRGGLVAVRGLGLLLGLEFDSAAACAGFVAACRARRVLVGWTLHRDSVVRLAPPLVIGEAEVELALALLRAALHSGDARST